MGIHSLSYGAMDVGICYLIELWTWVFARYLMELWEWVSARYLTELYEWVFAI